jgi:hypothetical protein
MTRDETTLNPFVVAVPLLVLGVAVAGAGYSTDWFQAPAFRAIFNISPRCNIKGEVNFITRERVYHVPGQFYYAGATVSIPGGGRWFCSEAEARRAGWRRSRH